MLVLLACWAVASAAQAAPPVTVTILEDTADRTVLRYQVNAYTQRAALVDGVPHTRVLLGEESRSKVAGAPELPRVVRSVLIGADAQVEGRVLTASYHDVPEVDVVPSKGILYRTVDPASVPYSFGPAYQQDAFYPAELVTVGEPYLLRDDRAVALRIHPFRANPAERVLRVYDSITVELVRVGTSAINVPSLPPRGPSRAFFQLAKHHFINHGARNRYAPIDEEGELLIIAHDAWLPNVAPLVEHKLSIGISTTAVGVSSIGNDPGAIKSHIQDVYQSENLAFVLLVGDAAQVATPQASGGASDPSYAKLAGSDDYPDLLVGRFSAQSAEQVDTQVERAIDYELQQATAQPWFMRAVGIASNEGPGDDGEMDWEHMDNIRTDLLGHGYSPVDQIYDPGATAGEVSAALNAGRGLVNYCGHGSPGTFGTTGFGISHVDGLSNVGQLPLIISVACNTGEFDSGTSLAEAFLQATHNGQPSGAVGMYASSISQSWDPPMAAQDETNDLLVAEGYVSFGALCFAGSAQMMDEYGGAGVEMYDTWNVFGDPSLRVVGVVEPKTGLEVSPADGLLSVGAAGGPFEPAEQSYLLESWNDEPLDFQVSHLAPWLTVTPDAGTLPARGSTTVTVTINSQAEGLAEGFWHDHLAFTNETDHDGDCQRLIGVAVGESELQLQWPLDDDPGWSTEGGWAFGPPTGSGGQQLGEPDPDSGHQGSQIYGYNLDGDYANDLAEAHLTTATIDCSALGSVTLRFWRWLNVDEPAGDHASVQVSSDGSSWTTVWENDAAVQDGSWQHVEIDLSSVADGQPAVAIRWTMGPTDGSTVASGWNIDDVELWGLPAQCVDADEDGAMAIGCGEDDCDDHEATTHVGATEICDDQADNDCDGALDLDDPDCDGGGSGGAGPGASPQPMGLEGMCTCRSAGRTPPSGPGLALLGLLGLALHLRRQRRRPSQDSQSSQHPRT